MKKFIYKIWMQASLILALLFMMTACEDSFENGGFDVNSPSNVISFKLNGTAGEIDQKT